MRLSELNGLLLPFLKKNANAIRNKGGATGEFPAYEQPEKIAAIGGGGGLYLHKLTGVKIGGSLSAMMSSNVNGVDVGAIYVISTRSTPYTATNSNKTGWANFVADVGDKTIKAFMFDRIRYGNFTNYDSYNEMENSLYLISGANVDGHIKTLTCYNENAAGTHVAAYFDSTPTNLSLSPNWTNTTCTDTVTTL